MVSFLKQFQAMLFPYVNEVRYITKMRCLFVNPQKLALRRLLMIFGKSATHIQQRRFFEQHHLIGRLE